MRSTTDSRLADRRHQIVHLLDRSPDDLDALVNRIVATDARFVLIGEAYTARMSLIGPAPSSANT